MRAICDIEFFENLLSAFNQKNTLSNFYMLKDEYSRLIDLGNLFYIVDANNLYVYVKKFSFVKLFYFLNDMNLYFNHDIKFPQVLEIVYRGEKHYPSSHVDFWTKSGFEKHLSRDCYFLKNNDLIIESATSNILIQNAQAEADLIYGQSLIAENLDLYTGDQFSFEELRLFAQAGHLYIAFEEGKPCGMLQADFKNGVFWLGHIVVDAQHRGKGIAKVLVEYYLNAGIELECNQFQLWVIQDNTAAVNLYKKYGFKYLNRSTCSMLKK
jgi:ribosomal protein S18 acetylase RimI-like enzyme